MFFNSILHFNCYVMFHCRNIINIFAHFPLYNQLYFCFFLLLHTMLLVSPRAGQFSSIQSLSRVQLFVTPMDKSRYQSEFIRLQSLKNFSFTDYCQNAFQNGVYFILLLANMRVPLVSGFCQFLGMISASLMGMTQIV